MLMTMVMVVVTDCSGIGDAGSFVDGNDDGVGEDTGNGGFDDNGKGTLI